MHRKNKKQNKPKKINKPSKTPIVSPEDIDIDDLYEKYKDDPRFQEFTTMKNPKCIGGVPDFR
jgi:hypothetical protein